MASSSSGKRAKSSEPIMAAGVAVTEEGKDVVDVMGRKVWDKDYYTEKAKNNIMFGPERIGRRKDPVIPLPSSQRTYLKQRSYDMDLEKNLGKAQVVTAHTIKPLQGGFWCSVCECLLKDSSTYLEHVNGRRHNRNLGMNMKVEKIGVDRVREKLKALRKEPEAIDHQDIAERIAAIEEEQEEKKRRKKEKKRKKKKDVAEGGDEEDEDDDEALTGDEKPPAKKQHRAAEGPETGGNPAASDEEDDDEEGAETEEQKMLRMMGLPTNFG